LNGNQRQLQLHEECAFEQETTHLPYQQAPVVVYPTTTEIIRLLVSSYQRKNADSSDKIWASKLGAILLFTNQIGHWQIALLVAKMQMRRSKKIKALWDLPIYLKRSKKTCKEGRQEWLPINRANRMLDAASYERCPLKIPVTAIWQRSPQF
jgi:hypothetical protein